MAIMSPSFPGRAPSVMWTTTSPSPTGPAVQAVSSEPAAGPVNHPPLNGPTHDPGAGEALRGTDREDGHMIEVRRIRSNERDHALATVVEAFRHDPQVRWCFPQEARYDVDARVFFGVLLDVRMEGGEVWVADDCAAVAMWNPPGGSLIGPDIARRRYADAIATLSSPGAERVQAIDDAVDPLLPSDLHWYLGVLACHPQYQRRGLARAVVQPVLAAADRCELPVALETSTPANVAYYTRLGFAVAAEVTLDDALTVSVMRREPSRS